MQSSRATEHEQIPGQAPESGAERSPVPDPSELSAEQTSTGTDLQQVREALARMEDRYKRAVADLDNYRKRAERATEQRLADARETLERDWLEALDSVERALRMTPGDEGLRAVLSQMELILARHGVRRLGGTGDAFDPTVHEAVDVQIRPDTRDHTVVEVVRSGFVLGDRVLRPAQVIVSRRARGG